jgi:hypothetical protein
MGGSMKGLRMKLEGLRHEVRRTTARDQKSKVEGGKSRAMIKSGLVPTFYFPTPPLLILRP